MLYLDLWKGYSISFAGDSAVGDFVHIPEHFLYDVLTCEARLLKLDTENNRDKKAEQTQLQKKYAQRYSEISAT